MTKNQAIDKMKQGIKMRHYSFMDNEWVTIDSGEILLEDDVRCSQAEFWRFRNSSSWEENWQTYESWKS